MSKTRRQRRAARTTRSGTSARSNPPKQDRSPASGVAPEAGAAPAPGGAAVQSAADGTRDRHDAAPLRPAGERLRDRGGFNPDYSYVIKDLRRIAVLAGSLIALLIVLSFFLR